MHRFALIALLVTTLVACTAAPPPRPTTVAPDQPSAESPRQPRSITMALLGDIRTLGGPHPSNFVAIASRMIHPFMNEYLTGRDQDDINWPRVAAELPSVDRGTWKVSPDGRMEVTWKLRPDVKWHDGTELTTADVAFSFQAALDPVAMEGRTGRDIKAIERVEVLDPYTFVAHWRETSRFGDDLSYQEVPLLPRHVLEAAFQADPSTLLSHPWFSDPDEFVGAGPYRPVEWVRGSHMTVAAFDQYFQGRPRIDRVTFRFIPDAQAAMASILAGAVDIAYSTPGIDEALIIQREWARSGAGTVNLGPNNFRYYNPQVKPEVLEVQDQRSPVVRRAYMQAMNRDEIVEALFPGLKYASDTSNAPGTIYYDAVKDRIVRYTYNPNLAAQTFADFGWTKGTDGILTKPGQRFHLELRSAGIPEASKAFSVMQPQFRRVGIDLTFTDLATSNPNEDLTLTPGWYFGSLGLSAYAFGPAVRSSYLATPANRYAGSNRSGYVNPALDAAFDNLDRSIRGEDQLRHWGDAWQLISADVAILPMWFVPLPYIVRAGITGPIPEGSPPTRIMATGAWNVHLWDVRA